VRQGIIGADDGISAGVVQGQVPHVGYQQRGVNVGHGAFPPGTLDRAGADAGADHAVPKPRKADQLGPDPARDVSDAGRPAVPAVQQPAQSLRLDPAALRQSGYRAWQASARPL